MSIMDDVVLNLILMLFPMLVYFMYHCYQELCMKKYNLVVFDVALISSMYLCFKFGHVKDNSFILLFCNVPIVIAYLKKQAGVALLLSFLVVLYGSYFLDIYIWVIILKFVCYFLVYYIGSIKKIKDKSFILSVVVVQGFFLGFDYYTMAYHLSSFIELLFVLLLFYICPFLLLYLFQLADHVTNLYMTVSDMEHEKQLRDSFFKITHEVKNPIAVCKGYLDMLDIYNHSQVEKYIPIISSEICRSLDIMNDFMEFSKIRISKDIIDINMLLEDVRDELKILIYRRNIKLDVHIMNNEVFIEGDYNRLKQVFINLFKNSIEAIDGEGKIGITTHLLKNIYYIEITDNGCGMDDDTLKKVKEMFFTTKRMGSGLGVSLSNEIILEHQGSLDYYSKLHIGTKVVVKLPVIML